MKHGYGFRKPNKINQMRNTSGSTRGAFKAAGSKSHHRELTKAMLDRMRKG